MKNKKNSRYYIVRTIKRYIKKIFSSYNPFVSLIIYIRISRNYINNTILTNESIYLCDSLNTSTLNIYSLFEITLKHLVALKQRATRDISDD